ncbi:hypothetical protein GCM10009784_25070 [Arthrobacter parietis]|uniref:Uncharacterized protein n=1 Tax=Arthrobacter parietis TaxID=271434 RepID=A0ABN3AZ61_9MICC
MVLGHPETGQSQTVCGLGKPRAVGKGIGTGTTGSDGSEVEDGQGHAGTVGAAHARWQPQRARVNSRARFPGLAD